MFKYSNIYDNSEEISVTSSNFHDSVDDDYFDDSFHEENIVSLNVTEHFLDKISSIQKAKMKNSLINSFQSIDKLKNETKIQENFIISENEKNEINEVKKRLNWTTSSITNIIHKNEILDLGNDYPDLSSIYMKKTKQEIVLPIVPNPTPSTSPEIAKKKSFNKKQNQDHHKNEPSSSTLHKNKKTQLCKMYFSKKGNCSHGKNCKFAHSQDELELRQCGFGKRCKMIIFNPSTSLYENNENSHCNFLHPNETKNNFVERLTKKN
jgi:hypothetical protein